MNYSINIYALKDKKNKKYILVYGFGVETKYDTKNKWIIQKIDEKLKLYKISKILDKLEYEKNIKNLNEIYVEKKYKIEFEFIERNNVISGINYNFKEDKPTNQLSDLKEFWNIDKNQLLEKIKDLYSNEIQNNRIKRLLKVISKKTSIDFIKEPHRFGNLEIYRFREYNDIFKFKFDGDSKLFQVYTEKTLNQDVYVKFHSKNNERVIINKFKILEKGERQIEFNLTEDSFHVLLEIWNASGDLIYFKNLYYMRSMTGKGSLIGVSYNIEDDWSRSIKDSTNHCLNDIEQINPISTNFDISIDPYYNLDFIYKAINDSKSLFDDYKITNVKGIFIPSTSNRKGEIDSFTSVKNLVDIEHIDKVIIFDPYFSIKAASKILPRIENKNLNIEIITSLTETDSDTGNKNKNYKENFKNFILENIGLLHENLKIVNILSGKKEAFHDRYIIRFLEDGKIDGYILSNSLNSMGQSYPFVIAPLENDIVNQIYDYIKELLGKKYREESYFKKLNREIIYDSVKNNENKYEIEEYILPILLAGINNRNEALKKCTENGYFIDNKFIISSEKYEEILDIVFRKWEKNKKKVLIGIGELLYHSNLYTIEIEKYILDRIKTKGINENEFIDELKLLTKEIEETVDTNSYSMNTIEKQMCLILNSDGLANIRYIYYNPGRIWYGSYLNCLYKILWEYSFEDYLEHLEEIRSPMMFLNLVEYMRFNEFELKKYNMLMKTKIPYTMDLTAHWIVDEYLEKRISMYELVKKLSNFDNCNKLYQGCIIMAELIFKYSINYEENKSIKETDIYLFAEKLTRFFNESKESIDIKIKCFEKFKDVCLENDMKFKIFILKDLKSKELKQFIISQLIERFISCYKEYGSEFDLTKDNKLIDFFIDLVDLSDDSYAEEVLRNINKDSAFFQIKEPLLKEINFEKWNRLKAICSWESNILSKMKNRGYDINLYSNIKN